MPRAVTRFVRPPTKCRPRPSCARLQARHEPLQLLGHLKPYYRKSKSVRRDGLRYWWLSALEFEPSLGARFHRPSEALALLRFAHNVDVTLCVDEVDQIWWEDVDDTTKERVASALVEDNAEIGVHFYVSSPKDLGPISERVFGVQPASPKFVEDYEVLIQAFPSVRSSGSIPVSLLVGFPGMNPYKFPFLLRQILQLVMAQQLIQDRMERDQHKPDALAASRFRIVDIRFETSTLFISTAEALQYQAQLCERGIRVRDIFPIDENDSVPMRRSIAEALQVLISPQLDLALRRPTHVYYSDSSTENQAPALFSAIQTSASVACVHLRSNVTAEEIGATTPIERPEMWGWAMYALFSAHAQHRVDCVEIWASSLDEGAIAVVRNVLTAADPLAALFEVPETPRQRGWLSASRFYLEPQSRRSRTPTPTECFQSAAPMTVRVIEYAGDNQAKVLVPGCGEAWVLDDDVLSFSSAGADAGAHSESSIHRVQHIKFANMTEDSKTGMLEFLQLTHRGVKVVQIDPAEDEFSVDGWVTEVLSICSDLEEIVLPSNVELRALREFVDCAAVGASRLRRLVVDYELNVETSDVKDFLDVLGNNSHALTRHLADLTLTVEISRVSQRSFASWLKKVLDTNQRIHKVKLHIFGPQFDVPCDTAVIRAAPLDLRSKLAYLSVLSRDRRVGGCKHGWLDSGVISIIFLFAAQHRMRTVEVLFPPTD